jgi:uncharacterized membrane protein
MDACALRNSEFAERPVDPAQSPHEARLEVGLPERVGRVVESLLETIAHYVGLTAEAIAILVFAVGVIQAAIGMFRILIGTHSDEEKRDIWLVFARWLVAGLTFPLAADVVRTTISPSWDDIGHLAANGEP